MGPACRARVDPSPCAGNPPSRWPVASPRPGGCQVRRIHGRVIHGLVALSVLGSAPLAPAQPSPVGAQPIPAEVFYRHADISDAELSPSGRWLAVRTGIGGARVGLMTVDLQNKNATLQAARFSDADIHDFHWVNDDRLVFNLVDLQRGGGDQRTAPGLFSVRPDGSELRELIHLFGDRVITDRTKRLGREPLHWDHTLLDVPIGNGNDVIVGEFKSDGAGDLKSVVAKRLDVTNGQVTTLSRGVPPDVVGWLFDPKGEPRVVETLKAGVGRVHWRGPGSSDWVELARFDRHKAPFQPRFVDAAGDLFVTTSDGVDGTSVLKRFDIKNRQPQSEALVRAPGFDFVGSVVFDRDTGQALGVRVETDAETTVWFAPRMKSIQQSVDTKLPGRINRVSCRRCAQPDAVVLVRSWSDQDPGQYWVYRPVDERWTVVGPVRKDVDPRQMATLDFHRIKARDGIDLPVWITTPSGPAPAAPRPAVVLVHGGPWVRGGHWRWDADAQFLASRGYMVIEPEFRGSLGYGERHFRAGWKQWGRAMQDDVADAVSWAVAKGWVDGKRVCIAGASYGGYATLMGLARHPELYRCGVAWVAVTDPRLRFELGWVSDLDEEWKGYGLPALLGDPVADAAALKAIAPVELAARIKAPLLLAFGRQDRRVPIEHGDRMRAALRAAGMEPEWVTYPGEGHGWLQVENRVDFAQRLERFLARHLQ